MVTIVEICFGKLPHSDMSWRGKWEPQQPVMNTSAEGLLSSYSTLLKEVFLGMILLTLPYHILYHMSCLITYSRIN